MQNFAKKLELHFLEKDTFYLKLEINLKIEKIWIVL